MNHYLPIFASIIMLFSGVACTPEEKDKVEDNVNPKEVVATTIKLSTDDLVLEKGANYVFTVTYTPSTVTNRDVTWVSTNMSIATVTDGIVIGKMPGNTEIIAKCGDAIDKCKVTVVISATGIKLDKSSLELVKGDSDVLVATIEPTDSTDNVSWETSDENIATVVDGVVTAKEAGEATITAKAGIQKTECKIIVSTVPVGAVDLGIMMTREDGSKYNLYWAKSNLCDSGLCADNNRGEWYAWGEIKRKNYYGWELYRFGSSYLSRYNDVDNKTVLDLNDDAAHVILGGKWRMPTDAEWTALLGNCTWEWKNNGYLVTGPNGNSIFLRVTGRVVDSIINALDACGYYWSSSLNTNSPSLAYYVYFNSHTVRSESCNRCLGLSIRPVSE